MKRIIILLFIYALWPSLAGAQYINTDSIIVLPGFEIPVSVCEYETVCAGVNFMAGIPIYNAAIALNAGDLLSRFQVPSTGKVISKFGPRGQRMHTGTDIKMNNGDTIFASYDGVVAKAHYYYGYGNLVVIDHGFNLETSYGHLSAFLVRHGDKVKTGDPVGLAGRTGRATTSHLHFEIRENDKPYNPELVFDFEKNSIRDEVHKTEQLAQLHKETKVRTATGSSSSPQVYKVQPGDSLWKISRRFRTSINTLCMLNNLSENSVLQVGQVIQILYH